MLGCLFGIGSGWVGFRCPKHMRAIDVLEFTFKSWVGCLQPSIHVLGWLCLCMCCGVDVGLGVDRFGWGVGAKQSYGQFIVLHFPFKSWAACPQACIYDAE